MALELFAGAGLGVLFGELQKEICRVKKNFKIFKPKLEELEETLALLYPVIQEIEELNKRLNRPNHGGETIKLRTLLEDGIELVSKCSKIPIWKRGSYGGKLVELENKILKFHSVCLLGPMARDQKQNLLLSQVTTKMMFMYLNQQGFSNITMGFTDPSDLTTASSTGSSNITISLSTFGESNTSGSSRDALVLLKGLIPCASVAERNLLADSVRILENKKFHKRKDDLRKIVTVDLSLLGYDCYICKSRWDRTPSYPAGEYEYIEVIVESERLFIDIDFRAEFEIARSIDRCLQRRPTVAALHFRRKIRSPLSDYIDRIGGSEAESYKEGDAHSAVEEGGVCTSQVAVFHLY